MGLFIEDGYTCLDTVPAMPGQYGPIRYRYRPALYAERLRYLVGKTPEDQQRVAADVLARHLVDWDVTDGAGNPVGTTPDRLANLRAEILEHMLNRIMGYSAPDGGGESEEARDRKNSSPG